jgi:opacity protein-like surface antigen
MPDDCISKENMSFTKQLMACLCALSALSAAPANAAEIYAGIDGALNRIRIDDAEFKPVVSKLRLGYQFSHYAFELHYGKGVSDDEDNQLKVAIDNQAALYFRVNYDINPRARIYLMAGAARTDINVTGPLGTGPEQYSDFSYAFGIEDYFPGVKHMRILLEYASMYEDQNLDIAGLSLGVRYNF